MSDSDISSTEEFAKQLGEATNQADLNLFLQRRKEEMREEFKEEKLILENQHGELLEVAEAVLLDHMQQSTKSVIHFYVPDFKMCRILNEMLGRLAKQHIETKFIKINAEDAQWFISKFKIETLPSVLVCVEGKIVKKFIGLEEFGNEYPNERSLKIALHKVGAISLKESELRQQESIFGYVDDGMQREDSDY